MDCERVTSSQQASTSGDSSRNLSSRGKSSTRAWQHQWRYMRSERARTDQSLPKVDWNRYHLQVSPGHAIPRHHVSQCLNTVLYMPVCNAIASKQFCQGCRSSCESVSCSRTLFVLSSFTSAKPVRLQILFVDPV